MLRNLKSLRMERGLSQQELADQLGINQQSVNAYENRATEPDINMIMQLANYFHTTVDYLIGYEAVRDSSLRSVSAEELRLLENLRLLPESLQANIKGIILESAHHFHKSSDNIDK